MIQIQRLQQFTEAAEDILQEYYAAIDAVMRDGRTEMEALLADAGCAMWVATVDSNVAGCVVFRTGVPTLDSGECKRLYVRPAFRRMGLAELLMDRLEQFAAASEHSWVYLDTNETFDVSIRLYRRRGYLACERYNNNSQANLFFRKGLHVPEDAGKEAQTEHPSREFSP